MTSFLFLTSESIIAFAYTWWSSRTSLEKLLQHAFQTCHWPISGSSFKCNIHTLALRSTRPFLPEYTVLCACLPVAVERSSIVLHIGVQYSDHYDNTDYHRDASSHQHRIWRDYYHGRPKPSPGNLQQHSDLLPEHRHCQPSKQAQA